VRKYLEEALEASRGVLGALTLVAVRQHHHEPRLTQPLLLATAYELVDHAPAMLGRRIDG
jgi:hypothetical protein